MYQYNPFQQTPGSGWRAKGETGPHPDFDRPVEKPRSGQASPRAGAASPTSARSPENTNSVYYRLGRFTLSSRLWPPNGVGGDHSR